MTTDDLTAALHACAAGLYPLEAGVALRTSNGTFLHRHDFTSRFIEHGTSTGDGTTPMAAIDWHAAITALHTGELPCSGGERRILLLSSSLADGIPVDLRDTVTGLDNNYTARLITAILRASGNGQKAAAIDNRHLFVTAGNHLQPIELLAARHRGPLRRRQADRGTGRGPCRRLSSG